MKTYEYKIVVVHSGSIINAYELDTLGDAGFRLVDSVGIFRPDSTIIGDDTIQLIFEKASGIE